LTLLVFACIIGKENAKKRKGRALAEELLLAELFTVYAGALTEKRREIATQHFVLDYSLGEIAENTGMTRQAVSDALKKTKQQLFALEQQLKLYEKTRAMRSACAVLSENHPAREILLSALED